MSQFIETNAQNYLSLDKKSLKKVIAPRFKQLFKEKYKITGKDANSWKEEIAISNLCKKLTDREYTMLRKQNAQEIEGNFAKLKQKLKKYSRQQGGPSVTKFFDAYKESEHLNSKSIVNHTPTKVNLYSKYNHKLINFTYSVADVTQIEKYKQIYKKWLNEQNNNLMKSPNYCRMTFVLEKLHNSYQRILKLYNNKSDEFERSFKILGKTQEYSASKKRIKTITSDILFGQ